MRRVALLISLLTCLPVITFRFCHILWQFLSQYGFTLKEAEVEVDLRLPSSVVHELAVSLGAFPVVMVLSVSLNSPLLLTAVDKYINCRNHNFVTSSPRHLHNDRCQHRLRTQSVIAIAPDHWKPHWCASTDHEDLGFDSEVHSCPNTNAHSYIY